MGQERLNSIMVLHNIRVMNGNKAKATTALSTSKHGSCFAKAPELTHLHEFGNGKYFPTLGNFYTY